MKKLQQLKTFIARALQNYNHHGHEKTYLPNSVVRVLEKNSQALFCSHSFCAEICKPVNYSDLWPDTNKLVFPKVY